MHFTTLFKFALVAFAAAPAAYAYGADYDYVEARDVDVSDHIITARALDAYYDSGAITARDLGEAIDLAIVERQLAGEDTQELEARLWSFLPRIAGKIIKGGVKAAAHAHNNKKQ